MIKDGRLWHIDAPHFSAHVIESHDGIIVRAAPILSWAINGRMANLRRYCESNDWTCVPESE